MTFTGSREHEAMHHIRKWLLLLYSPRHTYPQLLTWSSFPKIVGWFTPAVLYILIYMLKLCEAVAGAETKMVHCELAIWLQPCFLQNTDVDITNCSPHSVFVSVHPAAGFLWLHWHSSLCQLLYCLCGRLSLAGLADGQLQVSAG